jgi:hypothetical protein
MAPTGQADMAVLVFLEMSPWGCFMTLALYSLVSSSNVSGSIIQQLLQPIQVSWLTIIFLIDDAMALYLII